MQAYKQSIFYPRYLFLFYGWYSDQWWITDEKENISCTTEQLERVIGPALAPLQDEFISNCSQNTGTGIVSKTSITIVHLLKFGVGCAVVSINV